MNKSSTVKSNGLMNFVLSRNLLAIGVIGSIVTFQFITTFKINITDPLLEFILPDEKFDFLNLTIRDGVELPKLPKKLILDFGPVLKEFLKWICAIVVLVLLAGHSTLPDIRGPGIAAVL